MSNIKKEDIGKYKEVIELFDEKTGEVVRLIRFKHPNEFNRFLEGFNAMGYPGYGWRYIDKKKFRIHNKKYNEIIKEK